MSNEGVKPTISSNLSATEIAVSILPSTEAISSNITAENAMKEIVRVLLAAGVTDQEIWDGEGDVMPVLKYLHTPLLLAGSFC